MEVVDKAFSSALIESLNRCAGDKNLEAEVLVAAEQFVDRTGGDRFSDRTQRLILEMIDSPTALTLASGSFDGLFRANVFALARAVGISVTAADLHKEKVLKRHAPLRWLDLICESVDDRTFVLQVEGLLAASAFEPSSLLPRLRLILRSQGRHATQNVLDVACRHLFAIYRFEEAKDLIRQANILLPNGWLLPSVGQKREDHDQHRRDPFELEPTHDAETTSPADLPVSLLAGSLNNLNTAVAIFDTSENLRFFNEAFQRLWDLDHTFLESAPDNALLLDRLRSEGKIAEPPDWRHWKDNVLAAYQAVDPVEEWWHLPDGRTINIIAHPQPEGGVTWVFENLTDNIDLQSRYSTAIRVLGETLDNLAEGVAVFGSDGRIRVCNLAFADLWSLDTQLARHDTHISAIRDACAERAAVNPWEEFVVAVTSLDDERRDRYGQAKLVDGSTLRYALINLPNGQVMITFVDVTDSVQTQTELEQQKKAFVYADRLKTEFVQHVSHELRSPLTNIIGFTQLLEFPATGPLNERQREYVEHIGSSSAVLLTLVDDILDLATVDAGLMLLNIGAVRVEPTVNAAVDLLAGRLREDSISLKVDLVRGPKTFRGDETRVRQILFNLLSNAANYAPPDSTISLRYGTASGGVEFSVHDDGPRLPPDILGETWETPSQRRRGASVGLSLVKRFVELHGGSITIDSGEDGNTVTCWFPVQAERTGVGIRAA